MVGGGVGDGERETTMVPVRQNSEEVEKLKWSHQVVYALGFLLNRSFLALWLVLKFVGLVIWGFFAQLVRNPLGAIVGLAIIAAFVSRWLGI